MATAAWQYMTENFLETKAYERLLLAPPTVRLRIFTQGAVRHAMVPGELLVHRLAQAREADRRGRPLYIRDRSGRAANSPLGWGSAEGGHHQGGRHFLEETPLPL